MFAQKALSANSLSFARKSIMENSVTYGGEKRSRYATPALHTAPGLAYHARFAFFLPFFEQYSTTCRAIGKIYFSILAFIYTDLTFLFFLNSQNIWRRSASKTRKHIQTARRWIRLSRNKLLTRGRKPVEKRKLSIWQGYKYFASRTKHTCLL